MPTPCAINCYVHNKHAYYQESQNMQSVESKRISLISTKKLGTL